MKILKAIFAFEEHKKWRIFGYQTNVNWFYVKTKFKYLLRRFLYSFVMQEILCSFLVFYLKLVYHTSKKEFVNFDVIHNEMKQGRALIFSFWHNRLLMNLFTVIIPKKFYKKEVMSLSSKHGDGKFVGRSMEKIGMISISGSSQNNRKSSRGIDIASFKQMIYNLKKGYSLGMTPDGPRGPAQKVHGKIVDIARISGVDIIPVSYSIKRHKKLNTWDKLMIPLPFSKLVFVCDEKIIKIGQHLTEEEIQKLNKLVEERMNLVQDKADLMVND